MSHVSNRPLTEEQYELVESLEALPISGLDQAIQKIGSTSLSNKTLGIQDFELNLAVKTGSNSYMEYTQVGDNITQVNYWTNSGKGTKLFTKDITYSGSNPTIVAIKDEITSKILTTTIAYSGDDITSVTKIII